MSDDILTAQDMWTLSVARACDAHLADLKAVYAQPQPAQISERPILMRGLYPGISFGGSSMDIAEGSTGRHVFFGAGS